MLPRKYAIKSWFIFPPHLTCVSTLPGETGNPEIVSFYLNAVYNLSTDTQNTLKYHLVTVKLSFTVKTIDCMHQIGPTGRKLERLGMSPTRSMITMSVAVSVAASKRGVILHQTWSEN